MSKLEEGKKLFEEQNYEAAITAFNEFLNEKGNHADALFFRALAFRKVGRFHESINDFTNMLTKLPDEASLYSERGVSYYHLKEYNKAVEDLDKAVSLEPNNPYRYSSRAYIRAYIDVEGAIADYEKTIELDPKDEIALNNLGLLLENKGNIKEAQKRFQQSNELIGYNPEKPQEKKEEPKINAKEELEEKQMGKVMLDVFRDKQTRKEYFKFIKGIFKKST